MPAAHCQRRRLAGRLAALNPHHLGARHHHLAGRGVAEFENGLNHSAFVIRHYATLLSEIDHLAQFDLGGEWSVAKSTARGQRITEQDQKSADRREQ